MKYVVSGLEDSGKSLRLARIIRNLVNRNSKWYDITGFPRPIFSNLHLDADFVEKSRVANVEIKTWHNLDEIVGERDCDVIIDEIGTYFDSRLWTELSLDVRRWLAQASKLGVDIYGTAQDFAQVDKSFRRLVNQLEHIVKFVGSGRPTPSRPPVKRVWGLCLLFELNPIAYTEDNKEIVGFMGIPKPFFISREDTSIYDTRQLQEKSTGAPLSHVERECKICGKVITSHA